jgi:hypothetical protein
VGTPLEVPGLIVSLVPRRSTAESEWGRILDGVEDPNPLIDATGSSPLPTRAASRQLAGSERE